MTWTDRCGKTIGGKAEHCPACHETFGSTKAGDTHRVDTDDSRIRRCLTVEEMEADKRLTRNKRGYWVRSDPRTHWRVEMKRRAAPQPSEGVPTREAPAAPRCAFPTIDLEEL